MPEIPQNSSVDSRHDEECEDHSEYSEDRENGLLVGHDEAVPRRESENGCPIRVPDARADLGPQADESSDTRVARSGTLVLDGSKTDFSDASLENNREQDEKSTFILGSAADHGPTGDERSNIRVKRSGTLVLDGSTSDSSGASSENNREQDEKSTFILGSPADQGPQGDERSDKGVARSGTRVLDGSKSRSSGASSENDGEYGEKSTFVLGSPADQGPQGDERSDRGVARSGTRVLDGSMSDSSDASLENDGEYGEKPTFILGSAADQGPRGDESSEVEVPRSGTLVLGTSTFQPSDSYPESEEVHRDRPTHALSAAADDYKHADSRSSENREITPGDIDQRDLAPVEGEAREGPDSRSRALSTIQAFLLGVSNDSQDEDHGEPDDRRPDKQTSVLDSPVGARPGNDNPTVRPGTNNHASSFDTTAVGRPGRGSASNGVPTEKPTHVIGTSETSGTGGIQHTGQRAANELTDDSAPRTTTPVGVESPCAAVSSRQLIEQLAITTLAIVVCATCAALSSGVWTLMYACSIIALVFGMTSFWRYISLSRMSSATPKSRPSRAPRQ